MSEFTDFASLLALDPGESLSTEGWFFIALNPRIIDRILKIGAVTHHHDAHAAMADPAAAPTLVISPTGGTLPAGTSLYLAYTLLDADGGETAPVFLDPQSTETGYSDPADVPVVVADYTAGTLLANNYVYAATVTDGAGGETALSPAMEVTIQPGFPNAQAMVSGLTALTNDASGSDPAAGWRMWRQVNGGPWYLVGTGTPASDTFNDTGFAGDCTVAPPDSSTTSGASSFTFNVPSAGQPAGAVNFCVYGSTDGSFTSPALLGVYPVVLYDTDLAFTDIAPTQGEPPPKSRTLPGANLIDPDTDLLDYPWKRPVATASDLPTVGNTDGDVRETKDTHTIYTWNAGSATWSPSVGAVGPRGFTGDTGDTGIQGPAGPPAGAQVVVNPVAGDAYQLALVDAGCLIEMTTDASPGTLTIPANATVNFPLETVIQLCQTGPGQINVVGAGGVTIRAPGGLTHTASEWATIGLRQRATNEWVLSGKLA